MSPAFACCKLHTYRVEEQKGRTRKRVKEHEEVAEIGKKKRTRKRNKEKDKIAKNGT